MLILVTGFAPFAGVTSNPSWDAVEALVDTRDVTTVRRCLPVAYDAAAEALAVQLGRLRPDAVVLTGLDRGASGLRIEERGRAVVPTAPDEGGALPLLPPEPGTPDLATPLDAAALAGAARGEGLDARVGDDAGSYVCNGVYRTGLAAALRLGEGGLWAPPTLFVHVPPASVAPVAAVSRALARVLAETARQVRALRGCAAGSLEVGDAGALLLGDVRPHAGRALRIGVSGGIGSGKSSVTAALRARGAVVADADSLAREVVEPGSGALREISEQFGPDVVRPDGTLDRSRLARTVFADTGARARLEAITLPRIAARAHEVMSSAPVDGVAVYDMPLLVEAGAAEQFDAVVMVDAPPSSRTARLARRGIDEGDARARMAAQAGVVARRAVATVWIDNDGTREDLGALVERVASEWLGMAPPAPVGGSHPGGQ